ncbi:MAG: hypothetical protein AABP62_02780 [Planctomycetota bacterium]
MLERSVRITGLMIAIVAWSSCGCRPGTPVAPSQGTAPATAVSQQAPRPVAPRSDYVGSRVCSECHREIADSYFQHPMGQSSAPIDEASAIEDYTTQTFYDTPDGHRYVVERTDGQTLHHEQFRTPFGETLYDQAVAMNLSIGSGRHGRSYASLSGNRFFQSPIGWYTGKKRWDMAPGYVAGRPPRFDRLLVERCLLCHIGRLNPGTAPDTWDEQEPIAETIIGCERCHGPGASHVERHRNVAAFHGVDAIVNPAKLDAVRRDAVCHQCHLQASKTILRYGRQPQDFRPGDRLSDIWVVLKGSIDDRKALTQSGQMNSSRCYLESGGKLGCISCHNPHGLPQGEPAVYFDAKCANCHGASHGECSLSMANRADRTCIGCHMPRFPLTDVPHTALTDHRILRRPDFSLKAASTQPTGDVFDEGEPALPEWEIRRARALALRIDRSLAKTPDDIARAVETLRSLEPFLAADPEVSAMLAWLAGYQQDSTGMEQAARRTLELTPHRFEAQEQLLQSLFGRQAWTEGETLCRQLIAQDSNRASYHAMLADVLFRQGKVDEGIKAAEQALTCDPTRSGVRRRLIEMYSKSGDLRRANEHQAVLSRLPSRGP